MKPFIKTTICLEEQEVSVMPDDDRQSIVIETKNVAYEQLNGRLYLTKTEAEALIEKIQEMIKYLEL